MEAHILYYLPTCNCRFHMCYPSPAPWFWTEYGIQSVRAIIDFGMSRSVQISTSGWDLILPYDVTKYPSTRERLPVIVSAFLQ